MQNLMKKGTATLLAGSIFISALSTTAFAAELNRNQIGRASSAATAMADSANSKITIEIADQIAQEIMHADYDYRGFETQDRGVVSVGAKGVKIALKFIKQNWSKMQKLRKNMELNGVKEKSQ